MMDDILKKYNLKYEDLTALERETLNTWINALQQGTLTVDLMRQYVSSLKDSVENELSKSDLGNKQDLYLKARLRNLLLLEAFMTTPEKAKQQLEKAIAGMASSPKVVS